MAGEVVSAALLEAGATTLQANLGRAIAERGDHCWINDVRLREELVKPGGGQYHRESIGRARRMMARAGWIESTRVLPNQKPAGNPNPSRYGTTSKRILWKTLGVRSPMTRGQQRRMRKEQERRPPGAQGEVPRTQPRIGPIVPELAALLAGVGPPSEWSARRGRTSRSERPVDRERRAETEIARKVDEARRSLEAWERAQRDREPPE